MSYETHYTDEQKASALAVLDASGGVVLRTANQLGIPESTLRQWKQNQGINPSVSKLREQKNREFVEKAEKCIELVFDVMPDKIADASLRDLAIALGILIDKRQMLIDRADTNYPTPLTQDREEIKVSVRALIESIYRGATELGETVTRAEVISRVVELRPAIKEYIDEIEWEQ